MTDHPTAERLTPDMQASADTRLLVGILKDVAIGGLVGYATLSERVGFSVLERRGCLESARRIAQRVHGVVFAPERGVGLRRLDDHGIAKIPTHAIGKARRGLRRALKKTTCIRDHAALTNDERAELNASAFLVHAFMDNARPKALKDLSMRAANGQLPPSGLSALALMGGAA